jgi:hypothetical protein
VVGDGLGGEGARSTRKQGLASVRARAWRASTCSDIVVAVHVVSSVCWPSLNLCCGNVKMIRFYDVIGSRLLVSCCLFSLSGRF